MGDEIVQQALEVAKLQSEAEIEQAKANAAFEERIGASEEREAEREEKAAETVVTVAKIQAERDVTVAGIVADSMQHNEHCCEHCQSKFAEFEQRLAEHERSMGERISILERAEPSQHDKVEKVPVRNIYTDRGKEEKKHTVKSASKPVRKDSLYFGR